MRIVYATLCVLGVALPLTQLVPWVAENGLEMPLLVEEAAASPISAFAWLDVLVSALTVLAMILADGQRLGMRHLWAPVVATLTVGVSFGLPLFLLLRQLHLSRTASTRPARPAPR